MLNIKIIFSLLYYLFISLNIKIHSATYPAVGSDMYVNILKDSVNSPKTLNGDDNVGWDIATSPDSIGIGLCWFPYGIIISDVVGSTGEVDFATPLLVDGDISLSNVVTFRLQSDLLLASEARLTKSGLLKCGDRRVILTGPFLL